VVVCSHRLQNPGLKPAACVQHICILSIACGFAVFHMYVKVLQDIYHILFMQCVSSVGIALRNDTNTLQVLLSVVSLLFIITIRVSKVSFAVVRAKEHMLTVTPFLYSIEEECFRY
jgi:hypothetical protein